MITNVEQFVNSLIMFYWMKTYFYRFNRDNIVSILDKFFKKGDNSTNTGQFEKSTTVIKNYGLFLFCTICYLDKTLYQLIVVINYF